MTSWFKTDEESRPSSSFSSPYTPYIDRNKILAAVTSNHPHLQIPDEVEVWLKEREAADIAIERLLGQIRNLQIEERKFTRKSNEISNLRRVQIRIRELLRIMRIIVDQKSEINRKMERFLTCFNNHLPMIFARIEEPKPELYTLNPPSILETPQMRKRNERVLKRQLEYARKIKQKEVDALQKADVEFYEMEEPPKKMKEKRKIVKQPVAVEKVVKTTPNAKAKRLNNTPTPSASPKKIQKPVKPIVEKIVTPRKKKVLEKENIEIDINDMIIEEKEKDLDYSPPDKRAKVLSNQKEIVLPPIEPPVTRGTGKRKYVRKSIDVSNDELPPKPRQRIHKSAEELAAKREERARVQKEKEEQRKTAEEIQKILEQEDDFPKRRAAAAAAVGAIHNLQTLQARVPNTPMKVSPKHNNEKVGKRGGRRGGRAKSTNSKKENEIDEEEETYCLCKEISYGEMVACDNDECEIVWFHFGCVNLKIKPRKGMPWYCPNCRGDKTSVMKKISK